MNDTSPSPGFTQARYYDKHFKMDAAKILPGEYFATDRNMLLVTVLGSCVAACIRDVRAGIGGMNHFMLPKTEKDPATPISMSARYGSFAMEILVNQLLKMGARREHLEAKVFGGGNVLRGFTSNSIGESNADFVIEYLQNEKIPIAAEDLLGMNPRKIYFFPATGKVFVKRIRELHNHTIVERESEYNLRLRDAPIGGDVELFK
ncbi:MAG TPA: chemoreceptor glutamine deamidase CheD [Usitatibacteraceae bacterium]|nr:chemoreceptor glutamine deamidase CheD [Usitatibacteraceae bacterium]